MLLLLTGFCTGCMLHEAVAQLSYRNISVGGEILFVPMVILLVWLGWILRDEVQKLRRCKNANARRNR